MKSGEPVWVELLPADDAAVPDVREGVVQFVRADGRIEVAMRLPLGSSLTVPFPPDRVRPRETV